MIKNMVSDGTRDMQEVIMCGGRRREGLTMCICLQLVVRQCDFYIVFGIMGAFINGPEEDGMRGTLTGPQLASSPCCEADSFAQRRLIWSALRPSSSPLISVHFFVPMRCTASAISASSSALHALPSAVAFREQRADRKRGRSRYLCRLGFRLRTSDGNDGRPRFRFGGIGKTYLAPNAAKNDGNGNSSSSQRIPAVGLASAAAAAATDMSSIL